MTIFNNLTPSIEAAEAITKNYTASVQETTEETPESVDNSPATDEEIQALHKSAEQGTSLASEASQSDRATTFVTPGAWVSPVQQQRQRKAMRLPSIQSLDDLDHRISAVMRFGGAPQEVATLAQKARTAVGAARAAFDGAHHPDNRRYAASNAAKDAVVQAIAKATAAVGALEATAKRDDIRDAWFDNLVGDLPKQRTEAAKALDKAAKAYAEWRQAIADADALAREQQRWGDWHNHPDARELNPLALIGELRKARDVASSEDDWVNGDYLTTEYDGIPPHTLAYLQASARRAPGSFAEMTLHRLVSPHRNDGPAHDTISSKDLRIINTRPVPALHPSAQADGDRPDWDN